MQFGPVSVDEAVGAILAHKFLDETGRITLNKGRILTQDDVNTLLAANVKQIIVARLDKTDLHENEAARRVGEAIAGEGISVKAPGVGRANLMATAAGPLRINVPVLERLNNIDEGITIATMHNHTLVQPNTLVTLVKIIPFGIPEARVADVEQVARESQPIISVRPLQKRSVALIISGPVQAQGKLVNSFHQPVRDRIESLGSMLSEPVYVPHDVHAIAEALCSLQQHDLIIVSSVSAIIDRDDIVPSALIAAGGSVTHYGVPVDPGTLLMLGYMGNVAVMGAPGCIKSPKTNVIDMLLPRLLAGERLTRADLVALGHGGLLEDIRERPMPRQMDTED